ncbi:uncharacterized protein LOC134230558 [Saccostrea cucullata]|uniref:uncharacterized protein LOC134230558 n=1 Tax=Saccostrea cuccullata TaxID=36930 RepID=UPI002ED5AC6B
MEKKWFYGSRPENLKDYDITLKELFPKVQPNKATGPVAIPARFVKELAEEITSALTFFHMSLNGGSVPDDWKMAHVVPIFKKGDKSSAAKYRPVSLTAICFKILEHILHSNILDQFERNFILTPIKTDFVVSDHLRLKLIPQ